MLISFPPHPASRRVLGWPETMTSRRGSEPDALARAVGTVLEGLTFYDLANAVVAEGRVKVACYVGGYTADAKSLPNQCPKCGAARYAFEKEIALSKAWEIASDTGRKSAAVFRDAAGHVHGRAKTVLEDLAREEDQQAAAAAKQLAALRT